MEDISEDIINLNLKRKKGTANRIVKRKRETLHRKLKISIATQRALNTGPR